MTRAMFVTVLYRYAGEPAIEDTGISFADVKKNTWYATAVAWAAKEGITFGTGNGKFNPAASISREQIVTMFHRYLNEHHYTLPEKEKEKNFAYAGKISTWAKESVKAMQKAGIIEGKPRNLFAPQDDATRAEAAAIFHRFVAALAAVN